MSDLLPHGSYLSISASENFAFILVLFSTPCCTVRCVMFREPYLHREPEYSVTIDVYTSHISVTAILELHITGSSLSQGCDPPSALVFSPSPRRWANIDCSIYFWLNQVTDWRTDTLYCVGRYHEKHF